MRTLLLMLSLISFTACSSDSTTEGGAAGGAAGKGAKGGGGSGGGESSETPGDGSETEANISAIGRCSGAHVEPPAGGGLGLTQDTALATLEGTWKAGLTAYQEKCLAAAKVGLGGNTEAVNQLEDGDLKEWATLVAAAQDGGQGNKQEVSEATRTNTELATPRDMTLTFSGGTVSMAGEETFSGAVSVVAVDGDKVTVKLSGDQSDQVDIYFASTSSIFVAKSSGGGTAFHKNQ